MTAERTTAEINADRRRFRFGRFELDARTRRLSRDGSTIRLTPKTFDILLYLVERAGHVVSRDEILQEIWENNIVEDGNLSVHISALRKLLGDAHGEARHIATVPRKGYSFVEQVEESSIGPSADKQEALPAYGALPRLTDAERDLRERRQTSNPEAYRTYLKGRRALRKLTTDSIKTALQHFEKAVELDPGYALAHVRTGLSYYYLNAYQQIDFDKAVAEIRRAVDRAFDLDPALPEAHSLRGICKMVYEWDWVSAEEDFRLAVELDPTSVFARCAYANALTIYGRFDDAWHQLRETLEIDDPLSLSVNTLIGSLFFVERRFEECVVHLQEVLEIHPGTLLPSIVMSLCFQQLGDLDTAVAKMHEAYTIDPCFEVAAYLGEVLAFAGKTKEAEKILNEIEQADEPQPVQTFYLYLALGELDRGLDFFERSLERPEIGHLATITDPRLDKIRMDPRFSAILRRMNPSDKPKTRPRKDS